ncbi:NAD(P)-dependent oxidoreductase [Rheinheimera mangrovi]|uniref:NAD(P)-dependent oxidoreductase n=1 Tax=Rheinheimera mangrovi TaxID=2498451 RepID=UPI000F8E0A9A|nr:NAD(P)H-binding protein [Rheinheimera mangrovi]
MNITLFGATGTTGPYLIEEGLKRGHQITVFARSQSSFYHPNVRTVRGNITDIEVLREAIRNADIVISALGPTQIPHPKNMPIYEATQAIIRAMKEEQVNRLIAVSTGTAADPDDGFDFKIKLPAVIIKYALPAIYNDIVKLADAIRKSDLNWTMVRVGFLNNSPASPHLNVGHYGKTKHSLSLSREDLAKFMFDQAISSEYLTQAPGLSSGLRN